MFTRKPNVDEKGLEKTLANVFAEMSRHQCDSEEFSRMTDQVSKLYPLKEHNSKSRVSPDTMAIVTANLLGIVLIVGHERAHIVTSKALNFVMKMR